MSLSGSSVASRLCVYYTVNLGVCVCVCTEAAKGLCDL